MLSSGGAARGDEEVPALHARGRRGTVLGDAADEQALAVVEADRAPHPPRGAGRHDGDAKAARLGGTAGQEGLDARADLRRGQREDEPARPAQRVDPQHGPARIEQRPAARPAGQGRGVLEHARHGAPAAPAQPGGGGRHGACGHPQPAAAGIGRRHHRGADAGSGALGPADGRRVSRVDLQDGEVQVGVAAREPAWRGPAAGEQDRHLVAAQVVGQGQDASWREHQAGPATGPAPEPDDGGGDLRDELLEGHLPPHGVVTC
jgi:hypothetical protein